MGEVHPFVVFPAIALLGGALCSEVLFLLTLAPAAALWTTRLLLSGVVLVSLATLSGGEAIKLIEPSEADRLLLATQHRLSGYLLLCLAFAFTGLRFLLKEYKTRPAGLVWLYYLLLLLTIGGLVRTVFLGNATGKTHHLAAPTEEQRPEKRDLFK